MYQHILLAVEFGKEVFAAKEKLKQLRYKPHSEISLIHIVEIPMIDHFPEVKDTESLYIKLAQDQLADIGKELNVPNENQYVEVGEPKINIPAFIDKHNIDLLVTGHHEKHGITRLLGSTAYALASRVKCDMLTIQY